MEWAMPWKPLTCEDAEVYENQLPKEVSYTPSHPLHGVVAHAIGIRQDWQDILFELEGSEYRYAVVHLTWRGGLPDTRLYKDASEVQQMIKDDSEEYGD